MSEGVAIAPSAGAAAPAGAVDTWRVLARSRLFWAGLALKVAFSVLFGSHFATRWFAPFVHAFVSGGFGDPWAAALARGEPLSFPYGPAMLATFAVPFLPAAVVPFDPAGHLALGLLRVPVLAADLALCLLLLRWLRLPARDVLLTWWLNPIVLYASYVHGQLDLVPTALLGLALVLTFERRLHAGAAVLGLAIACKLHLLVALPFLWLYVLRLRIPLARRLSYAGVALGVAGLVHLPVLGSAAFRTMVLGTPEAARLWMVVVPFGPGGPLLYLAPVALGVLLLRYASFRKLNRDLTLLSLGVTYAALVALVPPMPGWFVWSAPFIAYHAARYARTGWYALLVLSAAYLGYFTLSEPLATFELLDPTFGPGTGARLAEQLAWAAPGLFSQRSVNVAWTLLFTATGLSALELYRHGVMASPLYTFRNEAFLLGIAGDSAAGKHTVSDDLARLLGPLLTVLYGDDDHRWARGDANWRRVTHLDPRGNNLGLQQDSIRALRRGERISRRNYDHATGTFTEPQRIAPADFVALVGLHPFYLPAQRDSLHLKVFLDPAEEHRREWKVARDTALRGHTREAVLQEIARREEDAARYVRPQLRHADVVLRAGPVSEAEPERVTLDVDLAGALSPLALAEMLAALGTVTVEWSPDETLTRDRLVVRGTASATALRAAAAQLEVPLDELVFDGAGRWRSGTRGVVQLVLLHAIVRRLHA
jgi:uridine kinase